MESLMGNGDGLRLAASRLRRDADLVASMGYRVSGASERVVFTGPAADRLHGDALSWRSTTNGVAQQLLSVAEMLDRAAQELENPGLGGSAVGLAAWGSGSPIQATVGSGDVSQGFTSSAYGGDVGSADSGYVTIGGYNPLPSADASSSGYVTTIGGYNPLPDAGTASGTGNIATIGGYNPLDVGTASGTGYVATIGGYNPIGTVGTASGTGNVATIGGQNPMDFGSGTGSVPLPSFNPFATGTADAGTGNIAVIASAPLYGSWFVPSVGYIPVDVPMVVQPEIDSSTYGLTPYAGYGNLFGGLFNTNTITRILTNTMPRFTSPSSPF